MKNFEKLDIRPLSPALGAEIIGIDLSEDLSDALFASLREALGAYGVIFFRDQDLTPEAHIAFAERLGTDRHQPLFQAGRGISDDR